MAEMDDKIKKARATGALTETQISSMVVKKLKEKGVDDNKINEILEVKGLESQPPPEGLLATGEPGFFGTTGVSEESLRKVGQFGRVALPIAGGVAASFLAPVVGLPVMGGRGVQMGLGALNLAGRVGAGVSGTGLAEAGTQKLFGEDFDLEKIKQQMIGEGASEVALSALGPPARAIGRVGKAAGLGVLSKALGREVTGESIKTGIKSLVEQITDFTASGAIVKKLFNSNRIAKVTRDTQKLTQDMGLPYIPPESAAVALKEAVSGVKDFNKAYAPYKDLLIESAGGDKLPVQLPEVSALLNNLVEQEGSLIKAAKKLGVTGKQSDLELRSFFQNLIESGGTLPRDVDDLLSMLKPNATRVRSIVDARNTFQAALFKDLDNIKGAVDGETALMFRQEADNIRKTVGNSVSEARATNSFINQFDKDPTQAFSTFLKTANQQDIKTLKEILPANQKEKVLSGLEFSFYDDMVSSSFSKERTKEGIKEFMPQVLADKLKAKIHVIEALSGKEGVNRANRMVADLEGSVAAFKSAREGVLGKAATVAKAGAGTGALGASVGFVIPEMATGGMALMLMSKRAQALAKGLGKGIVSKPSLKSALRLGGGPIFEGQGIEENQSNFPNLPGLGSL